MDTLQRQGRNPKVEGVLRRGGEGEGGVFRQSEGCLRLRMPRARATDQFLYQEWPVMTTLVFSSHCMLFCTLSTLLH